MAGRAAQRAKAWAAPQLSAIAARAAMPDAASRCDHRLQHGVFAAMEMGGAGRVDHQSVRRIGRDDRRIAQRPEREPFERSRDRRPAPRP